MRLVIKNVLFTLLVPCTVAVYLPLFLAPERPPRATALSVGLAGALFAVGAAGYLWCLWNFAWIGRGTPAPMDMPRRLVVVGPHRWVRNPMYLSVLCVVAGWAVLHRSLLLAGYLALVAALFHLAVVLVEEPQLARAFPGEYAAYRQAMPRWLPRAPVSRAAPWRTRTARAEDGARLARLAERTFRDTFGADNASADMDEYCARAFGEPRQRAEIEDGSLVTLVVEDGDRLVGYAQFGPGGEPACVDSRPAWELRRLYVERERQGSGLARELMAQALGRAARAGAEAMWLGVWERNARAIRFYEKAGFAVVGEHVFQLGSDAQRDLIMLRRLDGRDAELP